MELKKDTNKAIHIQCQSQLLNGDGGCDSWIYFKDYMYANVSTYWWFFRILDIYSIYYFFNFPEAVKNIDKNTYLLYCIQVNSYTSSIGVVFFCEWNHRNYCTAWMCFWNGAKAVYRGITVIEKTCRCIVIWNIKTCFYFSNCQLSDILITDPISGILTKNPHSKFIIAFRPSSK